MAGWEEELTVLLRNLGVTQEEPSTRLRSTRNRHDEGREEKLHPSELSQDPFGLEDDPFADAAFLDEEDEEDEEDEAWLTDLNEMRREVDSIVNQVIRLMQRGDLDKSLKEDVMVVLRALRRPTSSTSVPPSPQQQAATSEEAYLESAASMLHFCRLVLRLSEVASEDR